MHILFGTINGAYIFWTNKWCKYPIPINSMENGFLAKKKWYGYTHIFLFNIADPVYFCRLVRMRWDACSLFQFISFQHIFCPNRHLAFNIDSCPSIVNNFKIWIDFHLSFFISHPSCMFCLFPFPVTYPFHSSLLCFLNRLVFFFSLSTGYEIKWC